MKLFLRKVIALFTNPFFPHLSRCPCCNRNWGVCTGHAIKYTKTCGVWGVCQACFKGLSYAERLRYYQGWFLKHKSSQVWSAASPWVKYQLMGRTVPEDFLPFEIEEDGTPIWRPERSITFIITQDTLNEKE